ncbi:hypothetical protein PROFUN_07213 [Planoprotostelium fungivorum]|uniref:Uncharacterized protein n=1 Tax=Planoprotostelium fungivorum TaxID=1890364 RepID=A0A2P6NMJ0_9EUKA|nr:hypothetical protein PROFUN_07213 [Planoprotostelium fungivorum]
MCLAYGEIGLPNFPQAELWIFRTRTLSMRCPRLVFQIWTKSPYEKCCAEIPRGKIVPMRVEISINRRQRGRQRLKSS